MEIVLLFAFILIVFAVWFTWIEVSHRRRLRQIGERHRVRLAEQDELFRRRVSDEEDK